MANDVWTDEQKAYLVAERAKGTPVPQIAAALGKPVPATYTRCRMLGSKIQQHTPWTPEAVERLIALATGPVPMTDREIAEALDKSITQMRWKLGDLGLIGKRTKKPKAAPRLTRDEAARAIGAAETAQRREAAARIAAERRQAEATARAEARRLRQEARAAAALRQRTEKAEAAAAARAARAEAAEASRAEKRRAIEQARLLRARLEAERAAALQEEAARLAKARMTAVQPVINLAPAPAAAAPTEAVRYSGRGGWAQAQTGTRRQRSGPAPTRDQTSALSHAAQDAVARFMAERGVTRAQVSPDDQAVAFLRRRGYVVVPEADADGTITRWTVDHRHEIASAAALRKFAEARGYA